MPSSRLILCRPLLLLPSIFPSIRVFSNRSVLHIRWPKYWSFVFSISPSNEYSGLISFRMDWLDLLAAQRTLKSLLQHHSSKSSVLQCSAFFTTQLSHQNKQNLVCTRTRRKEQLPHQTLTQGCPGVSRSLQQRRGWVVAAAGLGALSWAVRAGDLLKEVPLSPSPPPQFDLRSNNREGTQPHPSTEVGLKIYWAWPRPSEHGPVSPIVGLSHQEASISLLSLSVRGQKEWKPQSRKTNQTDHMDHSLV